MGGDQDHKMKADLLGFFHVLYYLESKLNILAWVDIRKKYRIMTDMIVSNSGIVHSEGDKIMIFEELEPGRYMWIPDSIITNKTTVSGYSFLTLVRSNKENFTPACIRRINEAKLLYKHSGVPGYGKFLQWFGHIY